MVDLVMHKSAIYKIDHISKTKSHTKKNSGTKKSFSEQCESFISLVGKIQQQFLVRIISHFFNHHSGENYSGKVFNII